MIRDSKKNTTCRVLRQSLSVQVSEFLDSSTLHGVRYLTAETGRHPCERVMWMIFLSIGMGASGMIIASLWDKFQTSPTITGLDADFHDWDVTFPAVTLCPSDPVKPSLLQPFLNESQWLANNLKMVANLSYFNLKYLTNISNFPTRKSLRRTILQITYPCSEIFAECTWKLMAVECCEYFKPVFTENGFCYSFNSLIKKNINKKRDERMKTSYGVQPEFIYETDPAWAIAFKSSRASSQNPMKVYIHAWNEAITRESRPQLVWDGIARRLAFSVKHTYTTQDARQLSIQQRKCVFEDEIAVQTAASYSYSACMQQCRVERAFEFCGCVPHFSPQSDNYPYCKLEELPCLAFFADELNDIKKCWCELGCDHMIYEVEKLTETLSSPPGTLEVGFVSWPMIRYKREVLFGWVDLMVSVGGIAGLFLGFSLLSGVEILYYFSLRAACHAIKTRREKTSQVKLNSHGKVVKKAFVKKNKIQPSRQMILSTLDVQHLARGRKVKWADNVVSFNESSYVRPYLN